MILSKNGNFALTDFENVIQIKNDQAAAYHRKFQANSTSLLWQQYIKMLNLSARDKLV